MSLALQEPSTAIHIYSAHGRNLTYLELVRQGDRVRVQPTTLGKRTLNTFWQVWLRMLILEKTARKHSFVVEIYRNSVVVSSDTTYSGLQATVLELATEIRPLAPLPLKRDNRHGVWRSYGPIEWDVLVQSDDNYIPIAFIKERMHLPKGATLRYNSWWRVLRLEYRNTPIPGRELAMIVELHFALACCT